MLQIADRVGQLNEQTLQHGHQQLAQIFDRLQLGVILMTVVTLLGGAVLAVYTSYLILRLQGAVRHSLEENVAARASLRNLSAKLLPHLASIRDLAQKGLREARNMALLLRPSMLDDFGLVPALNWQAKETMKRTGLRVQISAADLPEDLPEEHKSCIYRIVQEALNNVARHAQARTVQISLQRDAEELTLSVQDDGTGFDAQRVRGLGLLGMEERVHHLGGVFAIDSRSGRGTLLKINLPLAALSMESAMKARREKHSNPLG
jgi:signal transduction histidine kinase